MAAVLMGAMFPQDTVAGPTLEEVWESPPAEARLGAYWWWLNGNVTKDALTSDLEAMKRMGFGSAVIFDANGAAQDDNDAVPAGPTFASPEWRELYRHALREAARLGLTLSLNIQSGWNLGGPTVAPEDAAKIAVWSETGVSGPQEFTGKLAVPKHKEIYQDSFVVAWRQKPAPRITASSSQSAHGVALAHDQDPKTFWASEGKKAEDAPTPDQPQWLQVELPRPVGFDELIITPRSGYGPSRGEIQVSDDGNTFRKIASFQAAPRQPLKLALPPTTSRFVRMLVTGAHHPSTRGRTARNVQIAELSINSEGRDLLAGPARIPKLKDKTLHAKIRGSARDMSYLLTDVPGQPGEEAARSGEVLDLSAMLSADGTLRWSVPEGDWKILRFGATIGPRSRVSTSSGDWKGHAVDVLDEDAFKRYWDAVVAPLIEDAGPLAGSTLKYLHTDSWEIEPVNWTPKLPAEFKARRGYDMMPWMPVIAGHIVDSREASHRFLNDFRRTLGDLAVDRHYLPFRKWAHAAKLQFHPESGGPHVVPIDAQQCLGLGDAPMSEFWAESWRHRTGDAERFFVKQPASAAHTNGRPLVMAEGFTTVGPHWQERIWNNLKPSFDKACTEGLNLLVWHAWVCSPESAGIPGQQYFAGTHLNPKVTWWSRGKPFFDYINRCQAMLQRGLPVSDVLYYYGDHVPNYTQHRDEDPAGAGKGYDYDVISEDVLLARVAVKDGRLVLPEGTSYRVLMLPKLDSISLPVLRKVKELAAAGAVIAGPRPLAASGLGGAPQADAEVEQLAGDLWSGGSGVKDFKTAREALDSLGLAEDFNFTGGDEETKVSYVHRRDGDTEIYFVASRGERPESLQCRFRVSGMVPELWDPVSGRRQLPGSYDDKDGHTIVPIDFTPCGSTFVIFRKAAATSALAKVSPPPSAVALELSGPWEVRFDPAWGGPASVTFDPLVCWTRRPEPGVKHYSGTATYHQAFDFPPDALPAGAKLFLDLGKLAEIAEVRLNGKSLGILWTPPFRVEVTGLLQPDGNRLEVDIVNFWPNRIIGDASLPPDRRLTRTNIRTLTAETELMESGLLGPVTLLKDR